ncbi:hypothetical protein SPH9361_03395 [Sphingobium sp. CECT 9361]|nr:hypothetical protein SPH9361_03395 [Sphingobium sp. CECT 9361]
MSKTLRTVAVIAGAVALVATGVGAAAGAGLIGTAGATAGAATVAGISASTLATIGTIASVAATVASIGAQLTAKKPPARGAVNQVLIASDAPSPYVMGRTYIGGILRHDVGYGATLKKVPNPYRAMVLLLSVAGPVQSVEATYLDYAPVSFSANAATGYYSGFLYRDIRLGQGTETALTPSFAGVPGWSSAHKLSSKCAVMLNLKFDKDGKRFASGVPSIGHVVLGVKVYDPRLDSTYPGGSGACRINDESTWVYSENPGLHALSYALGRYRVGKKVFGVGLPGEGIRIADFVTLANVCDANGWKVGGGIYEPGDRWANLKEILQAGGAEPLFTGGKLGCKINAPRVSLDTVTAVDLADDDAETTPMQSWRNRRNGIIPKYRSEAHKWEYVPSDLVSVPAYVTEDGEEKIEERQYNLVQQKNQAAQLAAYELVNGRELFPITLVCKPRLRKFGPGDMLTLNLPTDHGLADVDAVIVDRSIDPATMKVTLTFVSETDGKHDFALGRIGTAPPTPSLTSPEDRDNIAAEVAFGTDGAPGTPGADGVTPYTWIAYADSADGQINFSTGSPGGRAYIGIAVNKTTPTESTNPADYQWSAYRGPSNFGLVNFNGNSIVGPNFAQKIAGSGFPTWGEASVYSSENFRGGAQTSFTFNAGQEVMAGLNTDPTTTASYTDIDYAFHLDAGGGNINIFENGTYIQLVGAYVAGTLMQIVYNGRTVKYLYGAALAREVPAPPNLRLYFDSAIAPIGGRIENITFAAAGTAGSDGSDGAPGAPGADGFTLYEWNAYADSIDGAVNFTTGAPGGRAFIGRAINKTTSVESTNPADYQWAQYTGPANFGLVNFNSNTIVGPNFIQKVGGSPVIWDASAYSSESFTGGAALSFKNPTNVHGIMVGLNSDPTTDASYASLDYAWYMAENSHLQIWESNSLIADYGVQPAGVTMQIVYNGKTVRYYHGATFVREVATTADRRFWFDTSLITLGARIENITWAAAGAAGNDGATGDTVRRIWIRSSGAPAAPTGNLTPSGWANDPPAPNGLPLWSSDGRISGADNVTLIGAWSTPVAAATSASTYAFCSASPSRRRCASISSHDTIGSGGVTTTTRISLRKVSVLGQGVSLWAHLAL